MLPGCFLTQNSAATAEYARQVSTANLRVAQLEALLSESSVRLEQLEEVIRRQGQNQADRLENLDQVNAEVSRLRGEIEVIRFELDEVKTQFADYQVSQERRQLHDENRLGQIETFLGVKPPPVPTDEELGLMAPGESDGTSDGTDTEGPIHDPSTDGPGDATEQKPVPEDPAGKLELAMEHMANDRAPVARAILKQAIDQHPDAPMLDEIRYRYAETFYNDKDWGKAALAFKKVLDAHPDSSWASWAMLRQGECFEGLGQAENARLFYDGVVQKYPRSDAAKEAKKKSGR